VAQQQLSGAQDTSIYEACRDEGRVLVTLDHDFSNTLRFLPEATAGLVVLECKGRLSPSMILARLSELTVLFRTRVIDRTRPNSRTQVTAQCAAPTPSCPSWAFRKITGTFARPGTRAAEPREKGAGGRPPFRQRMIPKGCRLFG
jgi:hypothetical protein